MKQKKFKHKCQRCGWEWESKLEKPASCPACKRYDYDRKK